MEHNTKAYHFVIKDLTSCGSSCRHGEEDVAIRSHVKKVLDGRRRRKPKPAIFRGSGNTERIAREGWRQIRISVDALNEAAPPAADQGPELQLARLPSPGRHFAFDCFGVLPVSLDSNDLALIRFYLSQSSEVPSSARTETRHPQVMRMPQTLIKSHTKSSMSSDIALASLMVYLTSICDHCRQVTWSQNAMKWMSKALNAMHKRLHTGVTITSNVLVAMVNLALAEAQRSDAFALRAHLYAVKKVIVAGGEQTQTNDFVLFNNLSACDTRLACEQMSTPIFPLSFRPDLTRSEVRSKYHEALVAMEVRGTRFLTLSPSLPHSMMSIIEDMVEWFKVFQRYLDDLATETQVVIWIQTQRYMSRYRLLSLELATPKLQAIRITLLIWSFIYKLNMFSDPTVSALVTRLEVLLAPPQQWILSVPDRDLVLWMLLSGAIADASFHETNWFSREVVKLFSNHTDVEECCIEMKAIMERFLYLEGVRTTGLMRLARRVVSGF